MTDEVYWIWMQDALGIGSHKVDKVLETIGSARALHELDEQGLRDTGFFTQEDILALQSASLDRAKRLSDRAAKLGCTVVTPDHPDYPQLFTHIHCKPCVLYVLGALSREASLSITMVGTRNSTGYGEDAAFQISADLASAGCQIVSGLAVGIDQAAHRGALSVHGRTVGFLACGMNVNYPGGSARLKRQILDEGGALATEYPFDVQPKGAHFHTRNRLMSALSDGTIVVQARKKSGALITARHAYDQDRDVFAVPGGIFDDTMEGCNRLIQDGAALITGASSILEAYAERFSGDDILRMAEAMEKVPRVLGKKVRGRTPRKAIAEEQEAIQKQRNSPEQDALFGGKPGREPLDAQALAQLGMTEYACRVYGILREEAADFDTLVERAELPSSSVLCALTELELADLVVTEPGRRYRL